MGNHYNSIGCEALVQFFFSILLIICFFQAKKMKCVIVLFVCIAVASAIPSKFTETKKNAKRFMDVIQQATPKCLENLQWCTTTNPQTGEISRNPEDCCSKCCHPDTHTCVGAIVCAVTLQQGRTHHEDDKGWDSVRYEPVA